MKDSLPEDFKHFPEWAEHDSVAMIPAFMRPVVVGQRPRGKRWGIWPLFFEEYASDQEPKDFFSPGNNNHPRFVVWKRIRRTDQPPGWYQLSKNPSEKIGLADLRVHEDYHAGWSETARRYLKKWYRLQQHNEFTISEISFEAYASAYIRSTVYKKIKTQLDYTERQLHSAPDHVLMYGVQNREGCIKAGMAVLWSPSTTSSYYLSGFMHPDSLHQPLMIGLMDHWHIEAKKRAYHFVHFGFFWSAGKDKEWKGFSQFKRQFCTHIVALPPILWRLVW